MFITESMRMFGCPRLLDLLGFLLSGCPWALEPPSKPTSRAPVSYAPRNLAWVQHVQDKAFLDRQRRSTEMWEATRYGRGREEVAPAYRLSPVEQIAGPPWIQDSRAWIAHRHLPAGHNQCNLFRSIFESHFFIGLQRSRSALPSMCRAAAPVRQGGRIG